MDMSLRGVTLLKHHCSLRFLLGGPMAKDDLVPNVKATEAARVEYPMFLAPLSLKQSLEGHRWFQNAAPYAPHRSLSFVYQRPNFSAHASSKPSPPSPSLSSMRRDPFQVSLRLPSSQQVHSRSERSLSAPAVRVYEL